MMKADDLPMTVRLEIKSVRAAQRLLRAVQTLAELVEDFPYREDLRQAFKDVRCALKRLTTVVDGGKENERRGEQR